MSSFYASKTKYILIFSIFYIFLSNKILCENMSEEDIKTTIESKTVTYGSSLRIQNIITKYYLSSFGMNWSTGSGLQIVTESKVIKIEIVYLQ